MGKSKKKIEKKKTERRKISQGRSHFHTAGPPSLEEIPEVFFQNSEDKKTPYRRYTFNFPRQKSLKPPEN